MLNLAFGWLWITLGFLTGALLGLGFHKDRFMGGYDSWPRRLTRLGHIAFFGTGMLNVLLGLTVIALGDGGRTLIWDLAGGGLIVGGIAMPLCCGVAAWRKRAKPIFILPVAALMLGGVLASVELIRMALVTIEGAS